MTDLRSMQGYDFGHGAELKQQEEARKRQAEQYRELNGKPVLAREYAALEQVCAQFGITVSDAEEWKKNYNVGLFYKIEDLHLTEIRITCIEIKTPYKRLKIPRGLTQLRVLVSNDNQLTALEIPRELDQLQRLGCNYNPNLSWLSVPYNNRLKIECYNTILPAELKEDLRKHGVRVMGNKKYP
jgi:hypothetical protein